jgi:hypothetical protein
MNTPEPSPAIDPASIVQRQLDAYNARDLAALLALYSADASSSNTLTNYSLVAPRS